MSHGEFELAELSELFEGVVAVTEGVGEGEEVGQVERQARGGRQAIGGGDVRG